MDSVKSLDEMPLMHPLCPDEPLKSQKIRFFPIDNYLVWYQPNEELKVVNIVRIMYNGRDLSKISV